MSGHLWSISGMGVVMSGLGAVVRDSRLEARAKRHVNITKRPTLTLSEVISIGLWERRPGEGPPVHHLIYLKSRWMPPLPNPAPTNQGFSRKKVIHSRRDAI